MSKHHQLSIVGDPSPIGALIGDELLKSLGQFKLYLTKTQKNPSVNHVHELRRVVRKLRTFIWIIPESDRCEQMLQILQDLKQLANILGQKRILDVAIKDAKKLGFPISDLITQKQSTTHELLQVLKLLAPLGSDAIDHRLKILLEQHATSPESALNHKLAVLERRIRTASDKPPRHPAKRHKLRIALKRLNMIVAISGRSFPSLLETQRLLGRWHDHLTLKNLCKSLSPAERRCLRAERRKYWQKAKRTLTSAPLERDCRDLRKLITASSS